MDINENAENRFDTDDSVRFCLNCGAVLLVGCDRCGSCGAPVMNTDTPGDFGDMPNYSAPPFTNQPGVNPTQGFTSPGFVPPGFVPPGFVPPMNTPPVPPDMNMTMDAGMPFDSEKFPPFSGAPEYIPQRFVSPSPNGNKSGKGGLIALIAILGSLLLAAVGFIIIKFVLPDKPLNDTIQPGQTNGTMTDVYEPEDIYEPEETFAQQTTTQPTQKEPDENNLVYISDVTANSHQKTGKYNREYTPEMAIDDDPNTCWMVYGSKGGAGSWIKISFDGKQEVTGVKLLNGNGWDGYYNGKKVYTDLFGKNGRIKKFTLKFSDGSSQSFTADDVRETEYGDNVFYLDEPVETSYVKLCVASGYAGSKYKNVVCLSEFCAFD